MWLFNRHGAASLRHRITEITLPQPFMCVNRSAILYDFCAGGKVIRPYSLNIALDWIKRNKNRKRRLSCLLEFADRQSQFSPWVIKKEKKNRTTELAGLDRVFRKKGRITQQTVAVSICRTFWLNKPTQYLFTVLNPPWLSPIFATKKFTYVL